MTFKWKITTPARVTRVEGVELCIPGIDCDFETGSGAEAVGVFEAEDAAFTKIFGFSPMARVDFAGAESEGEAAADDVKALGDSTPASAATGPKKRGPKPKTPAPEAVAPDPIPVVDPLPNTAAAAPDGPAAAAPLSAPPPALPTPSPAAAPDVPPFLDRRPAAAAPPPPLPTIPAPPIAAAAPPPVGVLGPKVVAALDEIKKRGTDEGAALSDWLAATGLTIKGASYDDACRAVVMISDAKLKASGVIEALAIAV